MKRRLCIDMDNLLVDFASDIARLDPVAQRTYEDNFTELATMYDTCILSTAPWKNPTAWSDKLLWVQQWFGVGENSPVYQLPHPLPPQAVAAGDVHHRRPHETRCG